MVAVYPVLAGSVNQHKSQLAGLYELAASEHFLNPLRSYASRNRWVQQDNSIFSNP
jgi:hypothetical protein